MAIREETLSSLFADVFQEVTRRQTRPDVQVTYYPYAGLNHTIRLRNQRVYVRVSDVLRDAPRNVHRALAHILISRLFNKPSNPENETVYREYTYQPHIQRASDIARRKHGYKQISGTTGRYYDLNRIFNRLNKRYFHGELHKPILTWSARRSKRILGHHDAVHDTIVISRSLDQADVPEYLIDYVVYHEMLHIKHRPRLIKGRRVFHTTPFRNEEQRFDNYDEAIKWLDKLSGRN
ncbi:MAG: M48 family peptidase [Blastocatellia bacterium]